MLYSQFVPSLGAAGGAGGADVADGARPPRFFTPRYSGGIHKLSTEKLGIFLKSLELLVEKG